ncbi:N-acetyltransferase family protein [Brevibacterium sp. GP-SGM9]|uniref:GNAT family N-acetyltransferase n=1 Tax=Brevibacterium sp. GP-SGM9 TaxID=3376990 RepID=UPI0039A46499
MPEIEITRIDPDDAAGLRDWDALMRDAYTAERTAAWWRSPAALLAQFAHPRTDKQDIALVAHLGGEAVGGAELALITDAPAEVELGVSPTHRRQGVATALAEAVEALLREAQPGGRRVEVVQTETYCPTGIAFAQSRGMRIGIEEHRLLLDLPDYLTADADRYKDSGAATSVPVVAADPDFAVTSWTGACPEEVLEDWAMLRVQMDEDVPVGDLTRSTRHADTAAIRSHEERMDEHGWILVSSLAHVEDRAVGYTEIMVSRDQPDIVIQEDTLVDRAHRGRGIGRALKVANMRQLQDVPEAAAGKWIQTYTATGNAPMLALNRDLGFRTVDTMTALEGRFD